LEDCFLKSNLTEVHLSQNLITDVGALCISKGLQKTSTMKSISLDSNKISNKGIYELAKVIGEKKIQCQLDNNLLEFIEPEPKDEDDPDAHALEINLFLAVDQLNYCEVITLCLDGADVNVQNETDGKTPLHIAALKGDLPLIKFLLTHPKIDINSLDDNQLTPIYCAAEKGHKEIVSILLEKKADFTIPDGNQLSVLHLLSEQGNKALVKLMIEKYEADINTTTVTEETCLHFAAKNQHISLIQYLIERDQMERKALQKSEGAPEEVDFTQFLNWQDSEGQTALHKVFQNQKVDLEVAKLLVSSGAEISIEDNKGETPLEHASEKEKSTLMIEARKFNATKQ
jgi:ankyrin repeat protein